ncbi:MAG TPA: dTDP-4-dehydrorhamnose reductase [Sphingomicrobium sp.]|nr:dTDP-4-dehydrorhamnose reductase [Sphingomicrobium sp.]
MRIVVTGRDGQVVRSLCERAVGRAVEVVPIGRPELDLSMPADAIISAIAARRPSIIVSAAAYTQVDKAESEPELAVTVNADGPRALAEAARHLDVPLIQLSTDYVFDGSKSSPYVETDPTNPQGIYGASKLKGEEAVLATHPDSAVLRTAWVYSPFGANFVKTMLRLAGERDEIAVVADQRGNPTSALDIADGVLAVAKNLVGNPDPELRGIFHMTADGEGSWAELADAVFEASAKERGPSARVRPISTSDYPTPARRPSNSRLDSSKLATTHGVRLPAWRQSVTEVVKRLIRDGA